MLRSLLLILSISLLQLSSAIDINKSLELTDSLQDTAFCIIGELRTLYCPMVWRSIKEFVVDSLGGGEVFMLVKVRGEQQEQAALKVSKHFNAIHVDVIDEEDNDNDSSHDNPKCPLTKPELLKDSSGNVVGCYGKPDCMKRKFGIVSLDQQRCFETIKRHESFREKNYTAIMKLRTDQQFCEPLDKDYYLKNLQRGVITVGHIDHDAMVPRSKADAFFNAANEVFGNTTF